jgi:outer membrane protein OmpA-like peptidoglycan-associated protein
MFYTNKGRKFSTTFDSSSSGITKSTGSQFVNYMEIPFNVLYKRQLGAKSKLIAGAGPYASFLFSGRESQSIYYDNGSVQSSENISLKVPRSEGKYKNVDFGINAVAGAEFDRLFVTANFSKGLTDFYQPNTQTGTFRHQVYGVTVGFYLSRDKQHDQKERDRDGDGVPDAQDACPRLKGSALSKGCPDKDGDGVADKDDNCPNIAGAPKRNGCPIPDSDQDGVNDELDKCPTVSGTRENNGCPAVNNAIKTEINRFATRVQFRYKSASLTKKSKQTLDEVVTVLRKNKKINVAIEGYTSSDGNPKNHLNLSQARAESVKEYLVNNGINAKRLKAIGFGDANPLNANKSEADRAVNRRVELKLSNN